jgi:hypothetical protein
MVMRANSLPRHIRGPPPNPRKEKGGGPDPSNLEGSNFVGFGNICGDICVR